MSRHSVQSALMLSEYLGMHPLTRGKSTSNCQVTHKYSGVIIVNKQNTQVYQKIPQNCYFIGKVFTKPKILGVMTSAL